MIDIFALALTHGLLFLGLWRMAFRADLDGDLAGVDDRDGAGA